MTARRRPSRRSRPEAPEPEPIEDVVRIQYVGVRGDGVGPGPVYTPFALPGEKVRALVGRGGRSRLLERLETSPERVAPVCAHFEICGGCALQHWAGEPYRTWKRGLVTAALQTAGVEAPVGPLIDAWASGRRRASLHAVRAKAIGFALGFSKRDSHEVFDLAACPVLTPTIQNALGGLRRLAETLLSGPGRLDLSVTASETGLDVAARGGPPPDDPRVRGDLARLAETEDWARLVVGDEPIAVRRAPLVRFGRVDVVVPPGAFLQATVDGEAALTGYAAARLSGAGRIADLYAGLGAFAFRLAERASVHAVEGEAVAVAALKRAAAGVEGLKPVTAERRDLAREPLNARELKRFDAVVLDPPFAGAASQVAALAQSSVDRVVMASCNPGTFARDAAILVDGGFRLDDVAPIDQFRWSAHVEMIGNFVR